MKFGTLKTGDQFTWKGTKFWKQPLKNRTNAIARSGNLAYFGDNKEVER
jgi:hypothetical protein